MRKTILFSLALFATTSANAQNLQTLIVGGGPDIDNNQAAIESNVRYVARLLPPKTPRTVLFADGNAQSKTVIYARSAKALPVPQRLLYLLAADESADMEGVRTPNLSRIDGASSHAAIKRAFARLRRSPRPTLLYFTGHGSPGGANYSDNTYELWGDSLSVTQLATQIARLPQKTPVALVMVQCYSGGFGNLLFEGGKPGGKLVSRDIAGFFAATPDRTAAGCTPEVDEAEYHDFTGYFFAALSGRDRVGRRAANADFNRDGRIGMNEAFCATLIADASTDVPTCTSDIFLRRFVPLAEKQILATPYSSLLAWANVAQRAALEGLSKKLNLSGEKRLAAAHQQAQTGNSTSALEQLAERNAYEKFEALREKKQAEFLKKWPGLRANPQSATYRTARAGALKELDAAQKRGEWQELLDAADALDKQQNRSEINEIRAAQFLRFAVLSKSIVLAHRLRSGQNLALKTRYEKLLVSEGRTLVPRQK